MGEVERIVGVLQRSRFLVEAEKGVQEAIGVALTAAAVDHAREVRLNSSDIIDFLAGGVGIEVKTKGGKRAILRQLERYAESDRIDALILVSNVAMGLPPAIKGKPVRFVSIGRGWM